MEMDRIDLQGMVFYGTHGANPEETALGQRFGVDLTVFLDLSRAGSSDDLSDTVSYSALFKLVRAQVEGPPSKLLEHLAARILRTVLESDQRIEQARVRLTKQSPPIRGFATGEASVSLERDRQWLDSGC